LTFRFQEITGLCEAKARNKQETTTTDHRVPAQPSANVSKHALHLRLPAKPIHAGTSLFLLCLIFKGELFKAVKHHMPYWLGWNKRYSHTLTVVFQSVYSLVCEKCRFESHKNTTVTTCVLHLCLCISLLMEIFAHFQANLCICFGFPITFNFSCV